MGQFDSKKYNDMAGKPQKEKAPKKQAQPKAVKKAAKKEEAPKEPEAPKEKSTDPWADCDKFTLDMDAWKRFYSNNDEGPSIEHFWANVITPEVKKNYSLWKGTYQYSHELTMPFMAANLIGGMFQRIEKLRKHCFSSAVVGGVTNDMNITGLWFWRGNSVAFKRSPDWQIDYEVYDWEKLDWDAPETKELVVGRESQLRWQAFQPGQNLQVNGS